MMYILYIVAVVSAIFLNTSILTLFGIKNTMGIAFAPMLLYIAIMLLFKKIRYNKINVYILILAVIIILFKFCIGQDYINTVIRFLVIPVLLSICFENLARKELIVLLWSVIIFYVANCGLSIVEWTLNRNFFGDPEGNRYWLGMGFFRSTSLLGHPLTNAQVVSVIMTFIAVSDFKKKYIQIILFFLGYVSLFCFNARGAILVVTIFTFPYFIWKLNKTVQKSTKKMIRLSIICMSCCMIYLVTLTPLGGKLVNMELLDSSGQTRLDAFQFYKHYQSIDEFLWGIHYDNLDHIIDRVNGSTVENGVIMLLLFYGIFFTIPMLLLLFRFQYHKLSVYPKYEKWLLLAIFFIIGTMNPNLAMPIQWVMWVFAYYAFRPEFHPQQNENDLHIKTVLS